MIATTNFQRRVLPTVLKLVGIASLVGLVLVLNGPPPHRGGGPSAVPPASSRPAFDADSPPAEKGNPAPLTVPSARPQSFDSIPKRLRPNEPPGFTRFAEIDGSLLPATEDQLAMEGAIGSWYRYKLNNPRLQVVKAEDAPASPPWVIQTKFPKAYEAGRGPVNWGGWDSAGFRGGQKQKFYLAMWVRIVAPDFENQSAGTKMGFVASTADPTTLAGTQSTIWLDGDGTQVPRRAFMMELHQEFNHTLHPPFAAKNWPQNANRQRLMTCGAWHQWEMVFELNEPDQPNGVFKMWIDGTLIMDYKRIVYLFGPHRTGFWRWKWNPTWGGRKGVRAREDYMQIDHVYMSGVKYDSPPPIGKRSKQGQPRVADSVAADSEGP